MTLTHGDLFSGLGGFSLAAQRAGMETRWAVEIDPIARSVFARHWPDVPQYEDVTTVSGRDLAPVDVITAGFPCVDLSVAGKRAGLSAPRSGLFWEITRIVTEMREATGGRLPAVLLLENVPGWLSSHGGRDFGVALDGLADCGALDIGWRILDARHFRIPQRRRRLFVVCDFTHRRASQILSLADGLSGHPAPRREAGQAPPARASGGAGSGGTIASPVAATLNSSRPGERGYRNDADTAENLVAYQATGVGYWREGIGPLAESGDNGSHQLIASAITASAGHHGHSSPQGDGSDNLVVAFDWQASANNDTSWQGKSRQHIVRAGDYAGAVSATRVDAVGYQATGDAFWREGANPLAASDDNGSNQVVAVDIWNHTIDENVSTTLQAYNGSKAHVLAASDDNGSNQVVGVIRTGGDYADPYLTIDDQAFLAANPMSDRQMAVFHPDNGSNHVVASGIQTANSNMRGPIESPDVAWAVQPHATRTAVMAFRERTRAEGARLEHQADLAYALTNPGDGGRSDERSLVTGMTVRRLTPTECARLQNFPDNWIPETIADSHHYRLLGNAVCVAVVEWLMRRVVAAMAE